MPLLMTQKEYAAHRGVGAPAVSNWKKANLLVFAPDPKNPSKELGDVERSDLVVGGKGEPTRGRPRNADRVEAEVEGENAPQATPTATRGMSVLETERLDEMRERTRSRRIDNDLKLRGLVSLSEYERRAGDLGRMCREGVHAVLRQNAERMAAETDPRAVIAVLGEAFDQLFERVANEVEAEAALEREVDEVMAQVTAIDDEEDVAGSEPEA